MGKSKKIVVGLVITAVAATAYLLGIFVVPGFIMGIQVRQARIRLLRETDHQALLDACRELSRRSANKELHSAAPWESWPEVPEVIRALRPSLVLIDREGRVNIELGNKWWPLGVWAFPEGYEKRCIGYGDRELVKGLWYYEHGYSKDPDVYDKNIDELLSKNRKLRKASPTSDPNSNPAAELGP